MIFDYILSITFIIFYIVYQYLLGFVFTKDVHEFSKNLIFGYLILSFFIALGGIPIQLMNLSWYIFAIYLLLVFVVLFIIILYRIRTIKINISLKTIVIEFCNQNWFLIFLSVLLVIFSIGNLSEIWLSNRLDDGYYLSLVSSLPYNENSFYTNPVTGFSASLSVMGSYIVNTIYSEYSVYCHFLGIEVSIFCRVFMSLFGYYLLANTVCLLTNHFIQKLHIDIKNTRIQYFSICLLLFGMNQIGDFNLYFVQDDWQFYTCMFYGSSIVRMMGIFLLIAPYLTIKQIDWKVVLGVVCIGITLISKSSIALPILFIVPIAYLITFCIFSLKRNYRIFSIILVVLIIMVSVLLGNSNEIQLTIYSQIEENKYSLFLYFCIFIFIISFFLKNIYIYKMNIFLLIILFFIVIDPFNNIFEKLSIYSFVACRALSTWIYSFIIVNFIYFLILMRQILSEKRMNFIVAFLNIAFIVLLFFSSSLRNSLIHNYYVLSKNIALEPNTSIILGNILEAQYEKTSHRNYVIMPEGVQDNQYQHAVAVILRALSPHSYSISAMERFGVPEDGVFSNYDYKFQKIYDKFVTYPSETTFRDFSEILDIYPINCVIFSNTDYHNYMNRIGFQKISTVTGDNSVTYYIYYKL